MLRSACFRRLVLLGAMVGVSILLRAEAAMAERHALVIGTDRHSGRQAPETSGRDASFIASKLLDQGFSVTLLINASAQELESDLGIFAKESHQAEVALIYVSGPASRGALLLNEGTSLSRQKLQRVVSEVRADHRVFIEDIDVSDEHQTLDINVDAFSVLSNVTKKGAGRDLVVGEIGLLAAMLGEGLSRERVSLSQLFTEARDQLISASRGVLRPHLSVMQQFDFVRRSSGTNVIGIETSSSSDTLAQPIDPEEEAREQELDRLDDLIDQKEDQLDDLSDLEQSADRDRRMAVLQDEISALKQRMAALEAE